MFDLETINKARGKVLGLTGERFLHEAVEVVADTLNIYFVAIYLVDEGREFVVLRAGSGEFGQRLLKYGHKIRISESGNFNEQAGTAVYLNEIRLAFLETGRLLAWKTSLGGISGTTIREDIELFVGSPLLPSSRMELFLPLQANGKVIGVLVLSLDVLTELSQSEILKLQELANLLAVKLA